MILVFLHGFPGVGKLTVAREMQALTGYPLFHNHLTVDLVTAVFEFGSPPFVALRDHIWLEVLDRAASAEIPGLLFTFVAERTVPEHFAQRAVETVKRHGGEVVFVELACDPAEIGRRVEAPGRREHGKLSSAADLEELMSDGTLFPLDAPRSSRRLRVDTTDTGPGEVAAEIVEFLHA